MSKYATAIALSLCFTLAAPALAAGNFVGCSLPLPPHTMPDAQGQPDGHATKILQAVARGLEWTLDIRYMPWLRLVEEAKAGHCDLVYTVLKRADYEEFLLFPQEAAQERANVLVVRRDSGIRYEGDLERFMKTHSLGLYRDKAVDERFEQLRKQEWAKLDYATTARQNLEKLMLKRFDAAIENSLTAVHELREMRQLAEAEILQPPLNTTHAYIAFPKQGRLAGQIQAFDQALSSFKQTDEFKQLNAHYSATP